MPFLMTIDYGEKVFIGKDMYIFVKKTSGRNKVKVGICCPKDVHWQSEGQIRKASADGIANDTINAWTDRINTAATRKN